MAVAFLRVRLCHTRCLSHSPLPRHFFSFSLFNSANKYKKRDSSPTLKDPPPPPPPPPNHTNNSNSNDKQLFANNININNPNINTNTSTNSIDNDNWDDVQRQIILDIAPTVRLVRDILHSRRYSDGECLTPDDEKEVVEKLLAYHPCSEDKIGCGLNSIMVGRHPQFTRERCLFIVRTDGGWTDFSYQKCLREYVRMKYPSHAERFEGEKLVVSYERQQHKYRLWTTGRLL